MFKSGVDQVLKLGGGHILEILKPYFKKSVSFYFVSVKVEH